ncbi:DUF4915 domain-containing protein [Longirhabdus pacifica]|uniref:DUF4915 domain-containing protein n=1 Tax=Longirhabdus pacifica TaxID=2305227 RepID=UPI0010093140|nr:DUF4915 domain-containing protein [Longirhabdus pacifica]
MQCKVSLKEISFPHPLKLIISCCNANGGIYLLSCYDQQIDMIKVSNKDTRGIERVGDHFYAAHQQLGSIAKYNLHFELVEQYAPSGGLKDLHGMTYYKDHLYIMETGARLIGKYELSPLKKIDEIPLHRKNHSNDLIFHNDLLYVSSFADIRNHPHTTNKAPLLNSNQGVVTNYLSEKQEELGIYLFGLVQPHSIMFYKDEMYFCNSGTMEVRREEETIIKFKAGYMRGLAIDDEFVFIGESISRNKSDLTVNQCGFHIYDKRTNKAEFIKLPSTEVYSIKFIS